MHLKSESVKWKTKLKTKQSLLYVNGCWIPRRHEWRQQILCIENWFVFFRNCNRELIFCFERQKFDFLFATEIIEWKISLYFCIAFSTINLFLCRKEFKTFSLAFDYNVFDGNKYKRILWIIYRFSSKSAIITNDLSEWLDFNWSQTILMSTNFNSLMQLLSFGPLNRW